MEVMIARVASIDVPCDGQAERAEPGTHDFPLLVGLLLRLVLRRRRDARSGGEREASRLVSSSCGIVFAPSFIHSFEADLTNASVVDAVLDKLATTPEHSHDGASTLLLTWPFERADGEGAFSVAAV